MHSLNLIFIYMTLCNTCSITVLSNSEQVNLYSLYAYLTMDNLFTRVQQFLQKSKEWLVCKCVHHYKCDVAYSLNWSDYDLVSSGASFDYKLSIGRKPLFISVSECYVHVVVNEFYCFFSSLTQIDSCCKLSGMPDLSLSFVNSRLLEDPSFPSLCEIKKDGKWVYSTINTCLFIQVLKERLTEVNNLQS